MTARHVDFWFDFVSGYSWIAMAGAEEFAREHGCVWRVRPIVLGVVIEQVQRKTIAQVEATHDYAVMDVERLARRIGMTLRGPPEHPFLSLKALRASALFQDTPLAVPVAKSLFAATWEHGRDLTDTAVVVDAVASVGGETQDLEARLAARSTKDVLRANTDEALAAGVFGAPFYRHEGELFWGQDRLWLLAERLADSSFGSASENRA